MSSVSSFYDYCPELAGWQIIEPKIEHEIPLHELIPIEKKCLKKRTGPIRVLIADDDEDASALMAYLLEQIGIQVTEAEDGQKALESAMLSKQLGCPYDLILMDIQMPIIDGYNVTWELRHRGYNAPIVAFTGKPLAEDNQAYKEAGCDYFLVKSEVQSKLPEILSQCLS